MVPANVRNELRPLNMDNFKMCPKCYSTDVVIIQSSTSDYLHRSQQNPRCNTCNYDGILGHDPHDIHDIDRIKSSNDITYRSGDNSVDVRFQFIVQRRLKYTHLGKGWPKHTQCLLWCNGLLVASAIVVKHALDEDDPIFAFKLTARKCIEQYTSNTSYRSELVDLINAHFS